MSDVKYIVTVNSETGEPTKVELIGDAGELTELDLNELPHGSVDTRGAGGISVVINIYGGTPVNPQGEVTLPESRNVLWRFPSSTLRRPSKPCPPAPPPRPSVKS